MKIRKPIAYLFVCVASFGLGFGAKTFLVKQELEVLININTRAIHSYAFNSMTQTYLADHMIEVLNAFAGKPVKELPEHFRVDPDWNKIERENGSEFADVPLTVAQAIQDSREFDKMFRNFAVASLMQADTMKNILKKVQNKEDNGN